MSFRLLYTHILTVACGRETDRVIGRMLTYSAARGQVSGLHGVPLLSHQLRVHSVRKVQFKVFTLCEQSLYIFSVRNFPWFDVWMSIMISLSPPLLSVCVKMKKKKTRWRVGNGPLILPLKLPVEKKKRKCLPCTSSSAQSGNGGAASLMRRWRSCRWLTFVFCCCSLTLLFESKWTSHPKNVAINLNNADLFHSSWLRKKKKITEKKGDH